MIGMVRSGEQYGKMIGTVRSGEQCGKMISAVRSGELGELSPPLLQEQNESEFEVCSSSSIGRENRWLGFGRRGKRGMDAWGWIYGHRQEC